MKHVYAIIVLLVLFSFGVRGQNSSDIDNSPVERTAPTLAFGVGTISYFGELNTQNKLNSPLTSRLAFSLAFRQEINYYLEFELNLWRGKISANERSLQRNLNFESQLFGFGMAVNYNFGNFLKEDHFVEPIIGIGVEVIGFSSKTDLIDQNGIAYNYWSDGTIRNLPESDPNAEKSVLIQRDYYYESDIKTSDMYNLDPYNTYTIGIPITIGANLILNDKWTFRAAMIYHFTGSDYFDGISSVSGNFEADDKNDRFIYSSASISYNFTNNKPKKEDAYEDFTPFFLDEDEDNDSINDFEDDCLITPDGVVVDEKGCPLDGDNDNIPDYLDDELYSAANAQVDSNGVTITDEVRDLYYVRYYDETGNYSPIDAETNTMQIVANKVVRRGKVYNKTYAVAIGEFKGEIPADLINNILSLPDVNTYDQGGNIIIAVGRYTTVGAALSRQRQLQGSGITTTDIIVVDENYNVSTLEGATAEFEAQTWVEEPTSDQMVYRVQIGAFTKEVDESNFKNAPQIIKIQSNDGYVRYYSGMYTDYNDAAKAKINLMVNHGMKSAFVVAFRGGNLVQIQKVDKTNLNSKRTKSLTSSEPLTENQKANLKFRVQIGSFTRQIPTDIFEQYMTLDKVKLFKSSDNKTTRYAVGEFDTYKEASYYKTQLRNDGYDGCYVVGDYFGKLIPAKQAIEMLTK